MPLLPSLTPRRLLNRAGSGGPRRLALIASVAGGVLMVGGYVLFAGHRAAPPARVAKMPDVDPLPGGPKGTPYYEDMARDAAKDTAKQAVRAGESSVAPLPGSIPAERAPRREETVIPASVPTTPTVVAPSPVAVPATPAPPIVARREVVKTDARSNPKLDKDQIAAYQQAIHEVLTSWGGKPSVIEAGVNPEDAAGKPGVPLNQAPGTVQNAAALVPAGDALAKRRPKHVLMPANRGVYGRTVIGGDSDTNGPIVVEAESGPVKGLRMSGSFERHEERLVVHLGKISMADGHDEKVDALLVTPDTLETAVASSVDEHYVGRFLLPAAAAFVSGLGQAIQQSDSTVQSGALGTVTAYNKLNFGKQIAVGAGTAATQIGTTLAQSAPKGPTVKLDANADVGIFFLSPLEVDE